MSPGRVLAATLLLALAACDKADTTSTTTSVAAPAGTSWATVTAATPEGGFRIGNPNARVKLLEFASLTCPHCADFEAEAMDTIRNKYVASGNVSYEFRNFVLNGPDFAASLLARCQGPDQFFALQKAFFTDIATWTKPFSETSPADQARISALPQDKQIAALAAAGQLDTYVRARGIPKAKFEQCLTNKAQIDMIEAMRKEATDTYKLTGTPGFIINGQTQEGVFSWTDLEPKLQAALR